MEGVAFTAVTGKKVISRIWAKQEVADVVIYSVLANKRAGMAFILDNRASFMYKQQGNSNPDLINSSKYSYVTNQNISDQFIKSNLLRNIGFEAIYGNPPLYWFQFSNNCVLSVLSVEKDDATGDCIGICILGAVKAGERFYAGYGQTIKVQAGKSYIIGGWLRTDNIIGKQGTKIVAHWLDATGKHIFDSSSWIS